jgi:hypothetical protein
MKKVACSKGLALQYKVSRIADRAVIVIAAVFDFSLSLCYTCRI